MVIQSHFVPVLKNYPEHQTTALWEVAVYSEY